MEKPSIDCRKVPDELRIMLKTYAKEAIRAQPFDLISWSAAYFRCLVDHEEPPTKARFEDMQNRERSLTKEWLKTLVKQIGKGYFVDRVLLQKRWRGIGLPEDDLLEFVGNASMADGQALHWLKLIAAMTLSLDDVSGRNSIKILPIVMKNQFHCFRI